MVRSAGHGSEPAAGVATRWRAHPLQPGAGAAPGLSLAAALALVLLGFATGTAGRSGASFADPVAAIPASAPFDRWEPLDASRKLWAFVALAIFLLCFTLGRDARQPLVVAAPLTQNRLAGSTSTITAVSGISFSAQKSRAAAEGLRERRALRRFQQKLKTIFLAQARERRGRGAQNLYAAILEGREIGGEGARPADSVFDFFVAHQNAGERGERRVVQHPPEMRLLFVERKVILLRGVLNRVVLGIVTFPRGLRRKVRRGRRVRRPA